jgi:PH domain
MYICLCVRSFGFVCQPSFLPLGNPEKEGWLVKKGHMMKNWRNRWFILKERQLYYFKSKESAEAKGRVDLQGTTIEECDERGQQSCFRLLLNGEELLVMSAKYASRLCGCDPLELFGTLL